MYWIQIRRPKRKYIFKGRVMQVVLRIAAGRRRNRRLMTNFASNCSRGDFILLLMVGEGRTRSRFLLLFCVWVPATFTFTSSVSCRVEIISRSGVEKKEDEKGEKIPDLSAWVVMSMLANGCFIVYVSGQSFIDLANFLNCSPSSIGFLVIGFWEVKNNLDNSVSIVCHSVYGWF